MEKVSSLWYRILDENPLPFLHSKARKCRLRFYQSLHLRVLNKLKGCEPKMWGSWSESFPLSHSCKFETSITSLEFTMVEMMNAGILSFSFKKNKFLHRITCFHLRRPRSYFSNSASQVHRLSPCCCVWVQGGLWASYSLWVSSTALQGQAVSEQGLTVAHNPSAWSLLVTAGAWFDHLKSQLFPLQALVITSTNCCYSRKTQVFIWRLFLYPEFSLGE